jgi:hypothetical protein
MANIFFQNVASEIQVNDLKKFLDERSFVNEKGCKIWLGAVDRDHYGVARVTIKDKRIRFAAHRLMYYLSLDGKFLLNPSMHVSHICHVKTCINFNHLSYEPPIVNNNRMVCKNSGECIGHHGYKGCIL